MDCMMIKRQDIPKSHTNFYKLQQFEYNKICFKEFHVYLEIQAQQPVYHQILILSIYKAEINLKGNTVYKNMMAEIIKTKCNRKKQGINMKTSATIAWNLRVKFRTCSS